MSSVACLWGMPHGAAGPERGVETPNLMTSAARALPGPAATSPATARSAACMSELRGLIATPPGRTVGSEGLVHADYRNGDHSLSMGGSGQNRRADGNRLPRSKESWGDLAR